MLIMRPVTKLIDHGRSPSLKDYKRSKIKRTKLHLPFVVHTNVCYFGLSSKMHRQPGQPASKESLGGCKIFIIHGKTEQIMAVPPGEE